MFIPSAIKSITEYTVSIPDGFASGSVVVTQDLNYSLITLNGGSWGEGGGTGGAGGTPANATAFITVSGSTITVVRGGAGGGLVTSYYRILVTEYYHAFMRQPVQRSYFTVAAGAGIASAAYTATGAKTEVRKLGNTIVTGDLVLGNADWDCELYKLSSTQVYGLTRYQGGGTVIYVAFEVVDWR